MFMFWDNRNCALILEAAQENIWQFYEHGSSRSTDCVRQNKTGHFIFR